MHLLPPTIATSYGPRLAGPLPAPEPPPDPNARRTLARAIEAEAIEAEHEGRWGAAHTLAWRAAALREAGV